MTRWDWFLAALCLALMVLNVAQGDALMAAIAGLGCGVWAVAVMDEVTR